MRRMGSPFGAIYYIHMYMLDTCRCYVKGEYCRVNHLVCHALGLLTNLVADHKSNSVAVKHWSMEPKCLVRDEKDGSGSATAVLGHETSCRCVCVCVCVCVSSVHMHTVNSMSPRSTWF